MGRLGHATLWTAVEDDRLADVEQVFSDETLNLAQRKALANSVKDGFTILMKAVELDRLGIVEFLMGHGANAIFNVSCALSQAAANGHLEIVTYFWEHHDQKFTKEQIDDALSQAAAKGHLKIVKYVLENHKNKFTKEHIDAVFLTAVRASCQHDSETPTDHDEIAKYLVEQANKRSDWVEHDITYSEMFKQSIQFGKYPYRIVKFLLDKHSSKEDDLKFTRAFLDILLHDAVQYGHLKIVKLLVQDHGVNLNIYRPCLQGRTGVRSHKNC